MLLYLHKVQVDLPYPLKRKTWIHLVFRDLYADITAQLGHQNARVYIDTVCTLFS